MIRWRWCVVFLVLLVPARLSAKMDKHVDKVDKNDENADDNDEHAEDIENGDDDDDDDEDEDDDDGSSHGKLERTSLTLKRTSTSFDFSTGAPTPITRLPLSPRTTKKPLECYVCTFKKGIALQACLDPWKHRVHTIVCQSLSERCYTWIVSKDSKYEAITRGCKSGCVSSPETICCEFSRCNNQALSLPNAMPQVLTQKTDKQIKKNLAKRPVPPTIMFFITVLLLLQTVVKVPII